MHFHLNVLLKSNKTDKKGEEGQKEMKTDKKEAREEAKKKKRNIRTHLPRLSDKTDVSIFTKVGTSLPNQRTVAELMQTYLYTNKHKFLSY
jgi:hypothetical protein